MSNPGEVIPPGHMSKADQAVEGGIIPRNPDPDDKDRLLDADEEQTLEHGGYGGEQEYTDEPARAGREAGKTGAGDDEYINQTDMTDQTGDRGEER